MTDIVATLPYPTQRTKPQKEWLSRKEAAIYLTQIGCRIAHKTLENLSANNNAGKGPAFTRNGWKMVQYRREDLDIWAAARMVRVG